MQPLQGIRVLTMEQAAALPFATRHLADLGAEVIRVQSHHRPMGGLPPLEYFRNKQSVGLDLSKPEGPNLFRELAATCDLVAHNYTPRVMEKYGLDFDAIRAIRPRIIYCALTGFGSTGPWCTRPLFGPGAEAMSGQNLMIGEPEALTPGRPGTITYADHVCGLYLLAAILAAVEQRDTVQAAQFIDLSLYETGVSHLGPVIAERSLGAPLPTRVGNTDQGVGFQQVIKTADHAWLAISCQREQVPVMCERLGVAAASDTPARCAELESATVLERLLEAGIACAKVQDMQGVVADVRRWQRGCFTEDQGQLVLGPVWGNGVTSVTRPTAIGADNEAVYREVVGLEASRLQALMDDGTLGQRPIGFEMQPSASLDADIDRGLVDRAESGFAAWHQLTTTDRVEVVTIEGEVRDPLCHRLLETGDSVAIAYIGKLFADLGWDVVRAERPGDELDGLTYRWGEAQDGAAAFLNQGKRIIRINRDTELAALAAETDVVVGDDRIWELEPGYVTACITPFGRAHSLPWSDLTLQAASGFMSLTGEFDQAPQQLPPFAAQLTGATGLTSAIMAAVMMSQRDQMRRKLDLSLVDVLTGFVHTQVARYTATGEVARREGRVKHALRMVPTSDGVVYCAPGAVQTANMKGVAELLNEPRLAEERFQTAEGRMQHWDDYLELMVSNFKTQSAEYWFQKAADLHLTFALVQSLDEVLSCPQLAERQLFRQVQLKDGRSVTVPGQPFRIRHEV